VSECVCMCECVRAAVICLALGRLRLRSLCCVAVSSATAEGNECVWTHAPTYKCILYDCAESVLRIVHGMCYDVCFDVLYAIPSI